MPFFECQNIQISGIACAVPEQEVAVDTFKPTFGDEVVDKFKAMTGIHRFRKTHAEQTASDLGFAAANHLLEQKKLDRTQIGAIVFVSHSTDYRRPATACVLHKRLGLNKNCAAFDMNLGCSAYPYGIFTLASMMQCSSIQNALLICAESVTKLACPVDRTSAMLFGDAGSASLLQKTEDISSLSGMVKTDGNGYRAIIAPAGGFRNLMADSKAMVWGDGNERSLYNLHMDGAAVFNFTITDVPRLMIEYLERSGTSIEDYDCIVLHQANLFILKQIARKLKIPSEKMPISLDRYGNTSAAAIPLTLCDAYAGMTDKRTIRALMCGFGVGLSWGVFGTTIHTSDLLPIIATGETFKEGVINSPKDLGA